MKTTFLMISLPLSARQHFPQYTANSSLVYLDTAAASLTPQCVLDKIAEYYTLYRANTAHGFCKEAERAQEECAQSREAVAQFLDAKHFGHVIFTRGTTEGINILARGMESWDLHGKTIVATITDHHANFVPWQMLAKKTGALFHVSGMRPDGTLDEDDLLNNVTHDTAICALPMISNVIGIVNPIADITTKIKTKNPACIVIVDAAQAAPHLPVSVRTLNCDALAFSGQKACGPTGTGALWLTDSLAQRLTPLFTGGQMVETVTTQKTVFQKPPQKFEAGTPHIAGIVALKEGLRFLTEVVGFDALAAHDRIIVSYCMTRLCESFGDRIIIVGSMHTPLRTGMVSFAHRTIHAHDLAHILGERGICVRAGHHCAMPLHTDALHLPATVRASFHCYTTTDDIDALIDGIAAAEKIFLK